jgi:hypothetical protein
VKEFNSHSFTPCPRVVNSITGTEVIQSDLGIGKLDRNESGALEAMDLNAGHRQTGNSDCLAPKRIWFVLALEE